MLRLGLVVATALVGVIAGCSSDVKAYSAKADISKVSRVKSTFGPDFQVNGTDKKAADPKVLSAEQLPPGLTYEPSICAKVLAGPILPSGLQGQMAAIAAEGNGNRFVVVAVETSQPLPFVDPGRRCSKIAVYGPHVQGSIEAIDAPHIDGARTQGVHRALQSLEGSGLTVEVYRYSAQFGDYEVVVTANPTIIPDQPVAPVDTQRARDLLVNAVAAIRS